MNEKQKSGIHDPLTDKESREIKTDQEFQFKRLWFFMLNSLIIYVFTYFLVYYFSQVVSYLFAVNLDISTEFYYFEIRYALDTKWDFFRTAAVSFFGPAIAFIIGLVLLDYTFKLKRMSPYFRMFVAWLIFQTINYFLGGLIAGSFTGIGIGYITDQLIYPNMYIYVFIALAAIAVMVYIGYVACEYFLAASPSLYWLLNRNHGLYLLLTVLIPYLCGTLIIFLIKYPNHLPQRIDHIAYDLILSLSMIFIAFPMIIRRFGFDMTPKISAKERTRKLHYLFLILTVILVASFRVFFT